MLHRSLSPAQPLRTGPLAEHDTRAFRRRLIHFLLIGREHHAVVAFRYLRRNKTLAHVGEYTLGGPRERITVTAASGRIEAENIARMQRIIGVAGRQTLRPIGLGIDPDIAGTTVAAALHAVRRNDVLHRTDGKARLSEIRYSRRTPSPPRNCPGPPESRISSKRTRRVGNSLSMISIGAILALLWLTVVTDAPSLLARAPPPPAMISYCT